MVAADPDRVTWVEDEGTGVDQGALEGIFERYTRTPNGQVQTKGHGIGLFIASELVRAQSGHMWVESERGRGATFFFSLPRWQEPTPEYPTEERR